MELKAFILAAGYGTRLRPITEFIPKPLLPLLGRPLLHYIIENLFKTLPLQGLALNVHHKAEQIEAFCKTYFGSNQITIFKEREILGTGGALKNAWHYLKGTPFLVHNGDILTNANLEEALYFHLQRKPLATLLVREDIPRKNLIVDPEGRLIGLEEKGGLERGFTGIAIYEPEFLEFLPLGFSSVVEGWLKALRAGHEILTYPLRGAWFDLGTPGAYLKALFFLLKTQGETVYVHPEAETENLQFQGMLSIEKKCSFAKGSFLKNVVVLTEGETISGRFENGILYPGGFIQVRPEEFLEREKEGYAVGFGGSERRFYRQANRSILMKDPQKENLERTIQYNLYLKSKSINVPKIKKIGEGEVLFEDLGDLSLYSYFRVFKSEGRRRRVLKKVLDEVVKLHTLSLDGEAPYFPPFDYEHFRWETSYFADKFLNFLCGLRVEEALEREFDKLAELSAGFPKNLMHRDLQSQNIMLKRGRAYFVDYQGARIGPPGYDLASLLWDPYVELSESLRGWALRYYIAQRKRIEPQFNEHLLILSLPFLRLQRHLQALGAYVNLSLFKGKGYFLKFIPQALFYAMEETALLERDFPLLRAYLEEAKRILKRKGLFEEL
uniref:Uncharacterized protein n=1 Tax=Caldimicrobium thiodismutans TaxID=1653476 RepID=A0A832GL97_9BACT